MNFEKQYLIYTLYVALLTVVEANLCENPENLEVVSCWNGNYKSFNFNKVGVLHFTHNRVKSWWIFENVTITNQLFLDYNLLKDFNNVPESFCDLKEMSLTHNEIKIIPKDALTRFRKLTSLRLCHNKISVIQAESFNRILIKFLYASHNFIENVDFVNHLENINELVLSNNRINSLEFIRNSLPQLKYLDLSMNFIPNITAERTLQLMTSIKEVNLKNNPINGGDTETELVVPLNDYKIVKVYTNTLVLRCNLEKLFRLNQNDRSCRHQEMKEMTRASHQKKTGIDATSIFITILSVIIIIFGGYLVCRKLRSTSDKSSNGTESVQPQTFEGASSEGIEKL